MLMLIDVKQEAARPPRKDVTTLQKYTINTQ